MDLTPLAPATQTLGLVVSQVQTLGSSAEATETLTPLTDSIATGAFRFPGMSTYPSSTTWPGLYGTAAGGLELDPFDELSEILTPLVEA